MLACKLSRDVIVVSDFWGALLRDLGIPATKVQVVPNFLLRSEIANVDDTPTVLTGTCVGIITRLVPGKRVDIVLDKLLQGGWTGSILVAGDGPHLPALKLGLRQKFGLEKSKQVTFLGWLGEVEKDAFFRQIDCLISLSTDDSFGYGYLEALGAGVPVIAPNIPQNQHFQDCEALVLTDADGDRVYSDLSQLVSKMFRENYRTKAIQYCESKYSETAFMADFTKIVNLFR